MAAVLIELVIEKNIKIRKLTSLAELTFESCDLEYLPAAIGCLISLKQALIQECNRLTFLPDTFCCLHNLEYLLVSDSVKVLPSNFGLLTSLTELIIESDLQSIPESFEKLSNLKKLELIYCSGFEKLFQNHLAN